MPSRLLYPWLLLRSRAGPGKVWLFCKKETLTLLSSCSQAAEDKNASQYNACSQSNAVARKCGRICKRKQRNIGGYRVNPNPVAVPCSQPEPRELRSELQDQDPSHKRKWKNGAPTGGFRFFIDRQKDSFCQYTGEYPQSKIRPAAYMNFKVTANPE